MEGFMPNRRFAIRCALLISVIMQLWVSIALGQARVTATSVVAAPFLGMGIGGPSEAMADAQVALPDGLMSLSGNPAHGGLIQSFQAAAGHHFEHGCLGVSFMGIGLPIRKIVNVAVTAGYYGKGMYRGNRADDWALGLTVSRRFGPWFSFGATAKTVAYQLGSRTYHAVGRDIGLLWMPGWLAFSGKREDGFKFGFSLANLYIWHDGEHPSYRVSGPGRENLYIVETDWPDLPVLFRIGFSWTPLSNANNRLVLAVDALHPNDHAESLNFGIEDRIHLVSSDALILRAGYRTNQKARNPFNDGELNGLTAGFGFSRSWASSGNAEWGYSWVYEKDAPDRHGIYLRFSG
jgi:hypothetical protein